MSATAKEKSQGKQRPVELKPLVYRLPAVEEVIGLKRTAIHEQIAAGNFPKPISLGPRAKGWLVAEIDAWLRKRADQREAGAGQ
jgi:prophage regulatory protein